MNPSNTDYKALYLEYLRLRNKSRDAREQAEDARMALEDAIQQEHEAWKKYHAARCAQSE